MSSKSADLFGRRGKWLLGDSRLSHFRHLCCRQHHLMSHCSWCFSLQSMNLVWIPNVERICVLTSLLVKITGRTTSFVTIFSTKKKSFSATNVQEYKNTFLLKSVIFLGICTFVRNMTSKRNIYFLFPLINSCKSLGSGFFPMFG